MQALRIASPRPGQFRLEAEIELLRPLDEIFAFFSDARNLERITPPWLRFTIASADRLDMRAGLLIDYRLTIRGIPAKWRSRIAVWEPPRRFVDEQIAGPYRRWLHEHAFEDRGASTLCRDRVDYAVPGGALVNRLFVQRQIEEIFRYRHKALQLLFGSVDSDG